MIFSVNVEVLDAMFVVNVEVVDAIFGVNVEVVDAILLYNHESDRSVGMTSVFILSNIVFIVLC